MPELDSERCYRALCARDRRFDGVFFVAVETTGIYCRPICTAKTPGKTRCRFFTRAAEAEQAGFRACLRCRPERAPGDSSVDRGPELVQSALSRIGAGALDRYSVDELARELGVTGRHFRRALEESVGVSPVALAQSRRLGLAKWLLQDTGLSMTEVAMAAGYGSIRRFNDAFSKGFGAPPSAVRRAKPPTSSSEGVSLTLETRPPFAGRDLLAFLRARAIPGIEDVSETTYRRFVRFGSLSGSVSAELHPDKPCVIARIDAPLLPHLPELVSRLRALFDLDARPDLIDAHLSRDARLAKLVSNAPGLRVPGTFDAWELAARAVLGQQVSVRGATTLMGRFVERFGQAPKRSHARDEVLALRGVTFPTVASLAKCDVEDVRTIGLPRARAQTLVSLAQALHEGSVVLAPGTNPATAAAALTNIKGIGDWTASYIAMRALGDPDVFLSGDLVIRKALGVSTPKAAEAAAVAWQPWRAYALMHLWRSTAM